MHRAKTFLLDRATRARRITGSALIGLLAGWALVAAKPSAELSAPADARPVTLEARDQVATPSIDVRRYSISGNHPWDRRE